MEQDGKAIMRATSPADPWKSQCPGMIRISAFLSAFRAEKGQHKTLLVLNNFLLPSTEVINKPQPETNPAFPHFYQLHSRNIKFTGCLSENENLYTFLFCSNWTCKKLHAKWSNISHLMQKTSLHIKQIRSGNNGKTSKRLLQTWSCARHSKIISLVSFQTELIVDLPLSLPKQTNKRRTLRILFHQMLRDAALDKLQLPPSCEMRNLHFLDSLNLISASSKEVERI